ncbi:hypothetical protein D3C78_1118580 [compost metagenome]
MSKSLWDFSVDLYARPGVADCCLQLQDEEDADVCLLLVALWLEQRGIADSATRAAQLERLARPWQARVSGGLRQLRRAWKSAAAEDAELAELRRQLATLELQAERILLERLETLSATWPADAGTAGRWLERLDPERNPGNRAQRAAAHALLREAARALAYFC